MLPSGEIRVSLGGATVSVTVIVSPPAGADGYIVAVAVCVSVETLVIVEVVVDASQDS